MKTLARLYFIFAALLANGPLSAQFAGNDLDALVEAREIPVTQNSYCKYPK